MKLLLITIPILLSITCHAIDDSGLTEVDFQRIHDMSENLQDCYEEIDLQYEGEENVIESLKPECIEDFGQQLKK